MFTPLPLLWVKVAVKLNTGDPPEPEFISAAVQFPLILPLFELFPHPASIIAIPSTIIVPSVFITLQFYWCYLCEFAAFNGQLEQFDSDC